MTIILIMMKIFQAARRVPGCSLSSWRWAPSWWSSSLCPSLSCSWWRWSRWWSADTVPPVLSNIDYPEWSRNENSWSLISVFHCPTIREEIGIICCDLKQWNPVSSSGTSQSQLLESESETINVNLLSHSLSPPDQHCQDWVEISSSRSTRGPSSSGWAGCW